MAKKSKFRCQKCGAIIEIYKKSKKHRLLVCPNHGIIASNPLPLGLLAAAAPAAIEAVGGLFSKDKKEETRATKVITDSLDKPNKGERYVKLALQ